MMIMEYTIDAIFDSLSKDIAILEHALLQKTYHLTLASEGEAISRATGKRTSVTPEIKHEAPKENADGENIHLRFDAILTKIKQKIVNSVKLSRLNKETTNQMIDRVIKSLPKKKIIKRSRAILKKVTESDKEVGDPITNSAYITDDEWENIVDDYKNEYVPKFRGPETVFDIESPGEEDLSESYGWEIENQITHDFVSQVREGQMDAADQNGIDDFEVIAIIDENTCEECCGDYGCVDFDGMLTSEIVVMTDGDNDVPPFHFNCRCTIAPVLENMPEDVESNKSEFDQWLNS